MKLERYSIGIGDRFGCQAKAQLAALGRIREHGVLVVPVWNKSYREHQILGTSPESVRKEADRGVRDFGWRHSYYVDADHIGLNNVDWFINSCDFFTLDVADFIGGFVPDRKVDAFVGKFQRYTGALSIPGIPRPFQTSVEQIETIARKYLPAVHEAGEIYRHIEAAKGKGNFIVELSLDETDAPQSPLELVFILAGVAEQGIPIQTIAPKFGGRFNKGVDYIGDIDQLEKEFHEDMAVIAFAIHEFALPENLKLSVHSGSDKFSTYGGMHRMIQRHRAGLHLKTAGTTWLEELIGLALAAGEGLEIVKAVYHAARSRLEELCHPYTSVIDIDRGKLPSQEVVDSWSGEEFAAALRHDLSCPKYNADLRQLFHVAYKVAAEMGESYIHALHKYQDMIAPQVTENLYERHLKPIFLGR